MQIVAFINFGIVVIVLGLSLLIFLSSQVLGTLDDITEAERQKHRSFQLANELFQSSEDLTKMARSYVTTGDSIYERLFFEILDIRNGKRPRCRRPSAAASARNQRSERRARASRSQA
jgi:hypothetical protein